MKETKECIVCGETREVDEGVIQSCCEHSMFYKEDLDMMRTAGWCKKSDIKELKRIQELKEVVGYFNDGKFMNQDYRTGIMDAMIVIEGHKNNLSIFVDHIQKRTFRL